MTGTGVPRPEGGACGCRGLAGKSGRCRRRGCRGLARDHDGRISALLLDTETLVEAEALVEGLEAHPAVDVLDTRCRATITVTCQDQTSQHLATSLPCPAWCWWEVLQAVVCSELRVVCTVCTV